MYRRCISSLKMNNAEQEIDIIDSLAVEYAFTIFLVALQYKCQCLASIVRKNSARKTSALTTANSLIVWKICMLYCGTVNVQIENPQVVRGFGDNVVRLDVVRLISQVILRIHTNSCMSMKMKTLSS